MARKSPKIHPVKLLLTDEQHAILTRFVSATDCRGAATALAQMLEPAWPAMQRLSELAEYSKRAKREELDSILAGLDAVSRRLSPDQLDIFKDAPAAPKRGRGRPRKDGGANVPA